MSPQQQNNENGGDETSGNAGPSMGFSLAILAAAPLGPPHYPLVEWTTNVSRLDNPATDFLVECVPLQTMFRKRKSDDDEKKVQDTNGEALQYVSKKAKNEDENHMS
ncbi:hypothetical protein V498_03771 [Pseudogymnoascus sp. VKM F-4517 (FW-2822)]|nr:hypothetical protein V498_03771 [Pseudogymnoascus sp. VKM F-4517 (FW-2822)]